MAEREDNAIEAGRIQAVQVIEYRRTRRAVRQQALASAPVSATAAAPAAPPVAAALLAELGPASSRVLMAEGDSWFDYPWSDVLSELEDNHGFEVEAVSHRGDRIEEMAYSGGQLDKFVRTLEKLIRNGRTPEAILLSGGGNDVAGDDFAVLLNHVQSPTPGLNPQVVTGLIDERIHLAYLTVLSAVTNVCQDQLGVTLPILVHGYDYAVPDGRGFWGGWGPLPGPWLDPGFREKGYEDPAERLAIVKQLIDRFNDMLIALPQVPGFGHVQHVELRGTLPTDPASYRNWWDNELHPTSQGYEAVAAKFAALL